MFIFKTIKLPNLFREEKYTKRGRKYYRKRSLLKSMLAFLKFAAVIWLVICAFSFLRKDRSVPIENYFWAEEGAYTKGLFDGDKLEKIIFEKKKNTEEAAILIFHSHFGEEYADEKENGEKYTVADAGSRLAEILAEKYGVTVVHDMSEYDIEKETSYERSAEGVEKLLKKYPTVRVLVDIHRDAYKEGEEAVVIGEKSYARLMPVVGVCGVEENGEKKDVGLENEFLDENLKFAYDFRKNCQKDICKKIYLKPYRYSTHMMPESILLEVGNEKSSFEEVENSLSVAAEAIVKSSRIAY